MKIKCLTLIASLLALFSIQIFADQSAPALQTVKPYSMAIYNQIIATIIQEQAQTKTDKLENETHLFLGKPYVDGSLGEGSAGQFDQNPLYRTDQFDCQTFVETMLALYESNSLADFQSNIIKVRYHSALPNYGTRNHFVSVDWNPENQKNGYIKDVTYSLFPDVAQLSVTDINKPAWFKHLTSNNIKLLEDPNPNQQLQLLQNLHDLSRTLQPVTAKLYYVPLTALYNQQGQPIQAMFDRIPNDSIIEIVRPDWDLTKLIGTKLDVSHLGFAFWINHQLIFRNASSIQNKVIDVPLVTYLQGFLNSPTVKGINIEQVEANA